MVQLRMDVADTTRVTPYIRCTQKVGARAARRGERGGGAARGGRRLLLLRAAAGMLLGSRVWCIGVWSERRTHGLYGRFCVVDVNGGSNVQCNVLSGPLVIPTSHA
jgi:hypothetical protein